MQHFDAIVVGGGLVGTAIAYGLAKQKLTTLLLDEGDVAFRASRGNFGLVWVQSKGRGAPHYQRWSRNSAAAWPDLAAEFAGAGFDVGLHQPGGIHICLSDAEMEIRQAHMAQMQREAGNFGLDYRMLSREEVAEHLPGIGPRVAGGSFTPYDGHASPLNLLRALHSQFTALGGIYRPGVTVTDTRAAPSDFTVTAGADSYNAPRLVLAAGLGNAALAPKFGLSAPVHPERGEILVTERTAPLLPMPTTCIRQTDEGSVMIGDSKEDAGYDTISQSPAIMRTMAQRAVLTFPWIAELNIVRAWSALRIMSPDGLPIYQQSDICPGAFVANCHSGVTLAGAHANLLAPMIAAGTLSPTLTPFSAERFAHVRDAA